MSVSAQRPRSGVSRVGRFAAVAALLLAPASAVVTTATPASAAGCDAGIWGSIYGWGDCQGIASTKKWQVKVSCTWAGEGYSSVITGPGHTDAKCNWGSARNASIIFL